MHFTPMHHLFSFSASVLASAEAAPPPASAPCHPSPWSARVEILPISEPDKSVYNAVSSLQHTPGKQVTSGAAQKLVLQLSSSSHAADWSAVGTGSNPGTTKKWATVHSVTGLLCCQWGACPAPDQVWWQEVVAAGWRLAAANFNAFILRCILMAARTGTWLQLRGVWGVHGHVFLHAFHSHAPPQDAKMQKSLAAGCWQDVHAEFFLCPQEFIPEPEHMLPVPEVAAPFRRLAGLPALSPEVRIFLLFCQQLP